MAVTYYSPDCRPYNGIQPRANLGLCSVSGAFNIATVGEGGGTTLVINDVIRMVHIPAGATILDLIFDTADIDASTTLTLSIGDGTTPGRFILESTVGQAGGVVRLSVVGSTQYQYTVDDTIDVKVIAAATSTAVVTGILKLTVFYTMDA
jgi:hypothetical protein